MQKLQMTNTKHKLLAILLLQIAAWALPINTFYVSAGVLNAESAKSSEVSAVSDRTPPPVPTGLSLTL